MCSTRWPPHCNSTTPNASTCTCWPNRNPRNANDVPVRNRSIRRHCACWIFSTKRGRPAFVLGRRLDVLAHNRLAGALITEFRELAAPLRNQARFVFFDPHARELYADWEQVAADQILIVYTTEPGSADETSLRLLANWHDAEHRVETTPSGR